MPGKATLIFLNYHYVTLSAIYDFLMWVILYYPSYRCLIDLFSHCSFIQYSDAYICLFIVDALLFDLTCNLIVIVETKRAQITTMALIMPLIMPLTMALTMALTMPLTMPLTTPLTMPLTMPLIITLTMALIITLTMPLTMALTVVSDTKSN
ncbi:hypothetical protein EDC96DRAFT_587450 [Choanephora cucurbitarum]|nr:hypothetical protein EDC96DRAFT_587450 [Choanephora cucurbitarum]